VTKTKRPWDGVIPADEQEIYRLAGFGAPSGFGRRPALLVIDVQFRTVGDKPRSIREAVNQYPTSCGDVGWAAVARIAELVEIFRRRELPIIYPYIAPKLAYDRSQFVNKAPSVMSIPPVGYDFVPEVAPRPGDILVAKRQPSAFSGTPLASYLVSLRVDSLILTGCTTSGCIRASVVDACSLNYKIIVPEDAVFDRSSVSHAVNLFDIASKYADVMPTSEAVRLVEQIHIGD
jgi:maleamate amidohydrolase